MLKRTTARVIIIPLTVLLAVSVPPVLGVETSPEASVPSPDRYEPTSQAEPGAGGFSPAGSLPRGGGEHTTTLLHDGRVLVIGGRSEQGIAVPAVFAWDPATSAFEWAGRIEQGRDGHTATLLPDGRVLVVGDERAVASSSPSIWDPASESFTPTGDPLELRDGHTATLLPDGRVLIVGGVGDDSEATASTELWDPATDTFTPAASLSTARYDHTATLLPDGRVLVVGGIDAEYETLASTELWDPASDTFSPSGPLSAPRESYTATLLADGRVLVVGGWPADTGATDALASAEVWDPERATFESAGTLEHARGYHTATLLPDGRVLVVGGVGADGLPAIAEAWDPARGTFSPAGSLLKPRFGHSASLLSDGRVLVVGGEAAGRRLASAEVWDPTGQAPETTATPEPTPRPTRQAVERELAGAIRGATWEPYRESPAGAAFDPFEAGARSGVIFGDLERELHRSVDYVVLFRFDELDDLEGYWEARAMAAASEAPSREGACADGRPGRSTWAEGEYLCYVSEASGALLRWTDEPSRTYGVMNAVAGRKDLKTLYRQWLPVAGGTATATKAKATPRPAAAFNAKEQVLLQAIPARIRQTCEPRRSQNPAGTIAAVQCKPASDNVRDVAYYLMELESAGSAFATQRKANIPDRVPPTTTRRCADGIRAWEFDIPFGWGACYRNDDGRANLRYVVGATNCRELMAGGTRVRKPALYIAVLGEDGDIASLYRWANRASGLSRFIAQPGARLSDMCPH